MTDDSAAPRVPASCPNTLTHSMVGAPRLALAQQVYRNVLDRLDGRWRSQVEHKKRNSTRVLQ